MAPNIIAPSTTRASRLPRNSSGHPPFTTMSPMIHTGHGIGSRIIVPMNFIIDFIVGSLGWDSQAVSCTMSPESDNTPSQNSAPQNTEAQITGAALAGALLADPSR